MTDSEMVDAALAGVIRPDAWTRWRTAPNPLLNGATPDQLIQAGQTETVLALIAALADGVTG